jgi:DNA-directed RNA polymerase subunit L
MPRRKPKNKEAKQESKKKEQELKDRLDSILLADDMLKDLSHPDIPPIREIRTIDLDTAKTEVEAEARSIMESLSRFFNGGEEMDETSYIRHKQKIDALSISTMALQIRTAQHAIAKLMDEIDSGVTDPKMFAVLAQLQNQIMQMPKNFSDYMSQMESNYKSLKKEEDVINSSGDLKIDSEGNIIEEVETEGKLKVRGTKTLMESLQATIKKQGEIKEAEFEEDDNLINPLKKDEGVDALGDKLVDGEENVDFDDDMF